MTTNDPGPQRGPASVEQVQAQMKGETLAMLVFFLMSLAIGLVVGWKGGSESTEHRWRRDCIKRGYAEHNQKTGQWQWKESEASHE